MYILTFPLSGARLARQVQQEDEREGQGRGVPCQEPDRHPLRHGEFQPFAFGLQSSLTTSEVPGLKDKSKLKSTNRIILAPFNFGAFAQSTVMDIGKILASLNEDRRLLFSQNLLPYRATVVVALPGFDFIFLSPLPARLCLSRLVLVINDTTIVQDYGTLLAKVNPTQVHDRQSRPVFLSRRRRREMNGGWRLVYVFCRVMRAKGKSAF